MRFLKIIYRFLITRIRKRQEQNKQPQASEAKPNAPARLLVKPPARRVLFTYGIFSMLFIVLAVAAWLFKGADLVPEHFSLATDTSNTDIKPKADDNKNTAVSEERPSNRPEPKPTVDPSLIAELQDKVERLKDEILQLDNELNVARIKQYIAGAQYLMEARTAPEQALSLLQAARTDI